jgi:DNA helicase HerA-like ATPase
MVSERTNGKEIVGTIVGVTNPREFYFTITPGRVQLQELVAIDAYKISELGERRDETNRVWAKVTEIERINPLFPQEAAQELAYQRISAFDTVISLSREMITAKCRVLGVLTEKGELEPLTYPLQPASSVYIPPKEDVENLIAGQVPKYRKLSIGHLRSREAFKVQIDGHSIVARHLAVLAATGAGKTVVVRKIVEELVDRSYPILIFDSHGDYVGLREVFPEKVAVYNPSIALSSEDSDTVKRLIRGLSGESIEGPQEDLLDGLLELLRNETHIVQCTTWMSQLGFNWNLSLDSNHFHAIRNLAGLFRYQFKPSALWESQIQPYLVANCPSLAAFRDGSMEAIRRKTHTAGQQFNGMLRANRLLAGHLNPLPSGEAVRGLIVKGKVSIVHLEGYSEEIRQNIVATVLLQLLDGRLEEQVEKRIPRFLTVIEEAHNFIPGRLEGEQDVPSLPVIRRIATEGRKYGMGLILISQRPNRVDATILSQCNSFIVLKIINPSDQNYVRNVVESIGEEDAKILPDLATGEALVTGECVNFPMLVKIELPKSRGKYEEEDFIKEFI